MTAHPAPRSSDLVEADLAYAIVGAFFRVYNALGPGLLEVGILLHFGPKAQHYRILGPRKAASSRLEM